MKTQSVIIPKKSTKRKTTIANSSTGKTLVVVESPAKARTINKYLGKNYIVEASVGHIKDLSKFKMGIDIENNYEPKYITIRGKADVIKTLKSLAKEADKVLIATDPDREGEAIAWHIAESVKEANDNIHRVEFNEITKTAIQKSIANPRDIDLNMFNSQQARRVMDRIIGFKVSPFLSNAMLETTTATLSAGRVQSVAMRLICEREEAIVAFEGIEYWTINADFASAKNDIVSAKLVAFEKQMIKNPEGSRKGENDVKTAEIDTELKKLHYIKSEEQATQLLDRIKAQNYKISEITKKKQQRKPSSPFTTSLLQQDASRKLGFSNKKTMSVAQHLYEGINIGADGDVGLITYMRTDSVRVAPEAVSACREFISDKYGNDYLPDRPPVYSSKSTNMQDAHEAIRPSTIKYSPESIKQYLDKDEFLLYSLIYNRFVASQMSPAIIEQTAVNIESYGTNDSFLFRANGSVIIFNGFLAVYDYQNDDDTDKTKLPKGLEENQSTKLDKISKSRSATKPPARFNEASLVKELDELGIGRPSTYAQIVSTILDREYVNIVSKAFIPTELGIEVNKVLVDSFPTLINVDFTAKMEEDLDLIADGNLTYVSLMQDFYQPFEKLLEEAETKFKEKNKGIKCELCGGDMVIKVSRKGRFLGCSNYPECKNTKPISANGKLAEEKKEPVIADGVFCEICGSPMYIREGRYGNFYGCSNYPECKGIKPILSAIKCPKCGEGSLVERYSAKARKKFWGCSNYPKCDYISNNQPIEEKCHKCGNQYLEIKYKKVLGGYEKYKCCPKCGERFEDVQ